MKFILLISLISLFFINTIQAQNVLDDIEVSERGDPSDSENSIPELAKEKIVKISPSRRIFLMTNEAQTFGKGDFISLLIDTKLAVRALVAKSTEERIAGIKITKIYSMNLWNQFKEGSEVQVLKGDDSYFTLKEKKAENAETKPDSKINEEDDLFNSTSLDSDEESDLEDSSKRLIKPDNIVSFNVGLLEGKDSDGSSIKYTQMNGAWAYQVADNIWGEMQLGTNVVNDLPSTGKDTRLTNIVVRGKYTFNAPFFSYLQPYIGYQVVRVSSPDAGQNLDESNPQSNSDLEDELDVVDSMKQSRLIFGVTILKRIVPGWFIRGDLGLDMISGGLSLEF